MWLLGRRSKRLYSYLFQLIVVVLCLYYWTLSFWKIEEHHAKIPKVFYLDVEVKDNILLTRSLLIDQLIHEDYDVNVDVLERNKREEVVRSLPNLPSSYANGSDKTPYWKSKCGKFPNLFDIKFSNTYWQVLHSSNGTFYLYNAYVDNRTLVTQRPVLRIIGMIDRVQPNVSTHCQLWYKSQIKPIIAKVIEYKYIWVRAYGNYRQGILQPYLITCVLPSNIKKVPLAVSLVEEKCDKSTNNLRIINNLPPEGRDKEDFAVCVKGLDFSTTDKSLELAEWLELLLQVGANKVFLYDMNVHPNVTKVLRYYQSLKKVDVTKITLPGEQPNNGGLIHLYLKAKVTNKRQNELIPYNDCLYKNMNRYKFIVLLDTDEVIVPQSAKTWREVMLKLAPEVMSGEGHSITSFTNRNVYFLNTMQEGHKHPPDVPKFMKFLNSVHRSANYSGRGSYVKCFHDPQLILTLHNHYPFSCLGPHCRFRDIPVEDSHLQHYRKDCVWELRKVCPYFKNYTVEDTSILRYKEPLVKNVLKMAHELGFIKKHDSL